MLYAQIFLNYPELICDIVVFLLLYYLHEKSFPFILFLRVFVPNKLFVLYKFSIQKFRVGKVFNIGFYSQNVLRSVQIYDNYFIFFVNIHCVLSWQFATCKRRYLFIFYFFISPNKIYWSGYAIKKGPSMILFFQLASIKVNLSSINIPMSCFLRFSGFTTPWYLALR